MCKPLTAKHAMMIISILDQLRKVLPVCCNSNCTELLRQVGVSASDILHRPRGVSRGLRYGGLENWGSVTIAGVQVNRLRVRIWVRAGITPNGRQWSRGKRLHCTRFGHN